MRRKVIMDKLSILIVDDRPENLVSMTHLLARDDLEILTASSGNEALSLMLDADLALVLLDVQMPDMDGFEVAELMKRHPATRHLPIIFLTAINKERSHVFSGYESGAVDYLCKPVDPFVIRSKVNIFLDLKRAQLARERLVEDLNRANNRLQELGQQKDDRATAMTQALRTPLETIRHYCQRVRGGAEGPASEEQVQAMEQALAGCQRITDLLNDVAADEAGAASLLLLRADGERHLPTWLQEELAGVTAARIDEVVVDGATCSAVVLPAGRAEAMSFLSRIEERVRRRPAEREPIEYHLAEIRPGQPEGACLEQASLEFKQLVMTLSEEGADHVHQ